MMTMIHAQFLAISMPRFVGDYSTTYLTSERSADCKKQRGGSKDLEHCKIQNEPRALQFVRAGSSVAYSVATGTHGIGFSSAVRIVKAMGPQDPMIPLLS